MAGAASDAAMRIERRLEQPRWLLVRRAGRARSSSRSSLIGARPARDRPRPAARRYRRLFDAAFVAQRRARPDARSRRRRSLFTGLAAAAAFRMRPVQHRRRGPALHRRDRRGRGRRSALGGTLGAASRSRRWSSPARRRRRLGADPGRAAGVLPTNEIITSLMLNYVAALRPRLPDLRQPVVLARHLDGSDATRLPAGQDAARTPRAGPSSTLRAASSLPLGFVLGVARRGRRSGCSTRARASASRCR